MKLRIVALIICTLILTSLGGCLCTVNPSVTDETNGTTPEETATENFEGYEKTEPSLVLFINDLYSSVKLEKGFEVLQTDAQRKCYELIDKYVWYVSSEAEDGVYTIYPITMYGDVLTEAQLHLVISAYTMDHPEVFWLDSKFAYYTTKSLTFLQLNSGLSPEQIMSDAAVMRENVDEIFKSMPGNLSLYDRELYLHDAFLERCEYADIDDAATDKFRVYTSLGGLVDFSAVCEGYSRAMQILLSACGIEAYYASGIGNKTLHMWNTVNLEGEWYFLDATWNDNDNGEIDYDHFNLTTQQLLFDHTISPLYWELSEEEVCGVTNVAVNFNIFVPECDNANGTFYSQNALTVTGFDDYNLDAVAERMAQAAERGEGAIYLYLDPYYLDFSSAVDNLFYSGDYAVFTCISRANDLLYGVRIKEDYVSTTESEEFSVVTVYLEYEYEN